MTYEECIDSLKEGSVVNFKEYTLDRHERKRLTVSIEGAIIKAIFPANETLSIDTLVQYYGEGLSDVEYLQLSRMNCPRIVLNLGLNENKQLDIKVIILNKDYYNTSLQEIEVINAINSENLFENEPNYVYSQRGW